MTSRGSVMNSSSRARVFLREPSARLGNHDRRAERFFLNETFDGLFWSFGGSRGRHLRQREAGRRLPDPTLEAERRRPDTERLFPHWEQPTLARATVDGATTRGAARGGANARA